MQIDNLSADWAEEAMLWQQKNYSINDFYKALVQNMWRWFSRSMGVIKSNLQVAHHLTAYCALLLSMINYPTSQNIGKQHENPPMELANHKWLGH